MVKDVDEQYTADGAWRSRLNAWKTSAFVFNEVGASVLLERRLNGRWVKTPGGTIELSVKLVGRRADRVYPVFSGQFPGAGYRDWRIANWGFGLTFGSEGLRPFLPTGLGLQIPDSREPVRAVRATGRVSVPGLAPLVFREVCSGDFC